MYYLHLNGAQSGPYTREQIEAMVVSNQVSLETLMWTEGQAEWQSLSVLLAPAPVATAGTLNTLTPMSPMGLPKKQAGLRRVLIIAGIVVAVIGVLAVGMTWVAVREYKSYTERGKELDRSSKVYVDEAIPSILKNWSQEEFAKRESSEFRNSTDDEALTKEFEQFRAWGPLVKYKGATGGTTIQFPLVMATYSALATCKKGEVSIMIMLIRKKDKWEILGFVVTSPEARAVDLLTPPAN